METFGLIIFYSVMLIGLVLVVFGLPGTVVLWLDALIYGWLTHFQSVSGKLILGLLALTVVAEVADNLLTAAGARRHGTSKQGITASIIGGIVGAVLGSNLIPFLGLLGLAAGPVGAILLTIIGPLAGAFAGSFLSVYWVEQRRGADKQTARRAGYGAVVGRAGGMILKLTLAVVMIVLLVRTVSA